MHGMDDFKIYVEFQSYDTHWMVRGNMENMACVCRWECDSGPSTRKHGDYGVCM